MAYWYNKRDNNPYATIRFDEKHSNAGITWRWVKLVETENYLHLIGRVEVAVGISQAQAKEPPLCKDELVRFDIYRKDFETNWQGKVNKKTQTTYDKFLCKFLPTVPGLGEGKAVIGKTFFEPSEDRMNAYLNGELKESRIAQMVEDAFIAGPGELPDNIEAEIQSVVGKGGGGGFARAPQKSAGEILDEKLKWFIDKHPELIEIHKLIDGVGQTPQEKAFLTECFHRMVEG